MREVSFSVYEGKLGDGADIFGIQFKAVSYVKPRK